MYDVIIVGAGPAGLSAALMLGRSRRRVLVCDTGRPRNAASRAMHGFLSRDGMPPAEFLRITREQMQQYTTVEMRDVEVVHAECADGRFHVTLQDGVRLSARKLLIATGVVDNLPSIAELQLLVPQATAASRGPQPAPSRPQPRTDASAEAGPTRRRRERATLWQDSSFFQDSFFAPDNRLDVSVPGDLGGIDPRQASRSLAPTEPREGSGDPDSTLGDGEPERLPGTGTHN